MARATARRKRSAGGKATTVPHSDSAKPHQGAKPSLVPSTIQPQSFAEKNRLFSKAGREVVSCLLHGRLKIHDHDIQLDAEDADNGAILINERLSCDSEFQKMWMETPCQDILKTLAQRILQE